MTRRRILLAELYPRVPQPSVMARWSSTDKHADIALSGGDLTANKSAVHATNWACVRASQPVAAGRWYWETTIAFTGTADVAIGLATSTASLGAVPGGDAASIALRRDGSLRSAGATLGSIGPMATGAVVQILLDYDAAALTVSVAGGSSARIDLPALLAGSALYPIAGMLRPSGATVSTTANFGTSPFLGIVPDGASAGLYVTPPSVATVLYLSSEAFSDSARQYDARISGKDFDVEIEREGSCWVWGNQSVSRRGSIAFVNADGGIDGWRDLEWRDAYVVLFSGFEGDSRTAFRAWAYSRVDTLEVTRDREIVLNLADPLSAIDKPLQPKLFPDSQPNAQAAGRPLPIVYGAPRYCTGIRLDTNPTVRNYQLADVQSGIVSISDVYDNGNRFWSADDPFTPHAAITAANGGDFTGWAGTPTVPSGWTARTPFGDATDRFIAAAGGMRCQSGFQAATTLAHSVALHSSTRYAITLTCSDVPTAGLLTFAVGSVTKALALSSTGPKSVTIDVTDTSTLAITMDGRPLDATIATLRANAVQVIDWTYYTDAGARIGFSLTNTPAGKITANPVTPRNTLASVADDIARYRFPLGKLPPDDGPPVDYMDVSGSATALSNAVPYEIAEFIDKPTTALALLRDVMDCWCGWLTSNRLGQIVFGRVDEPASTPALTLDATNVIDEPQIEDDTAKGLTLRIAGRRNHSVHSDNDIATSVTDAMRAELTREFGITCTGAPLLRPGAVNPAYEQAVSAPARATLLQRREHIQAEANRVATLWRPKRSIYRVAALLGATDSDSLEPGQTVRLVWPRYGLQGGKNLLVVGVRSRFFSRRVDLKLWG